jgi:hypothetical protein
MNANFHRRGQAEYLKWPPRQIDTNELRHSCLAIMGLEDGREYKRRKGELDDITITYVKFRWSKEYG